jgi:methyl-accepting chemotaxis protein
MHFLGRFRIQTKILFIVGVLAILMADVAYIAINALAAQNNNAEKMTAAAKRTMLSARAVQNVIALNRAEYQAAFDLRIENRTATQEDIAQQFKVFHERIAEIKGSADSQVQAMLPAVERALSEYEQTLKATGAAIEAISGQAISDTAQKLLAAITRSRAASENLQAKQKAITDRLNESVGELEKETANSYASTSRMLIGISIVSVIGGILLGFLIGQYGVERPIRAVVATLQHLASGDYKVDVHGTDRKDEVGAVATAALVFKDNGLAKLRMEAEQKEAGQRTAAQRRADMLKLADDLEAAVGEIVDTVTSASTELEASAATLTSTAERSQEMATTVAAASEEAAANVQSVASASEELSSSVDEIGRQLQDASRIAHDAVAQARSTTERVAALSKAATRIGDVIELINTIAGQTNLLALNATIEAARAGEAGRGFAVVASEVKALAEQTAKATGEISNQVSGIQMATEDSVGAIKEISSTIARLSEISSAIAAAVEEQGAATQEISRNIQQAAEGTQRVSSNIVNVQCGATETGTASSQVLSAAQSLSSDSSRLKLEVGKFVSSVRAA